MPLTNADLTVRLVAVLLMTKPKQILKTRVNAYTLTEVLIVLVIIGILVLLTLPNLMPLVTKAKSMEAKQQLGHLQMLEKSYYYEHSRYSNDLVELGFIQEKLSTDGKDGHANYRLEVTSATTTGFSAKAVAVVDFNGNGNFNVWEIDQDKNLKEITPD
jgi:type IV pilus assembly protein PilE